MFKFSHNCMSFGEEKNHRYNIAMGKKLLDHYVSFGCDRVC